MTNKLCTTLIVSIVLLTYFVPRAFGHCLCQYMPVVTILLYIVSLYSLKFAFVLHGHFECIIADFREMSRTLYRLEVALSRLNGKMIAGSLFVLGGPCIILVSISHQATCKGSAFGCETSFNRSFGLAAIVAMTLEAIGFLYFVLKVFFEVQEENRFLIRRFVRCGILGLIFVAVSLIDVCISVAYPRYETLVVVLLDCVVMITCNLLAFCPVLVNMDCCCSNLKYSGKIARKSKTIQMFITGTNDEIKSFDFKTAESEKYEVPVELQTIPEESAVVKEVPSSSKVHPTPASTPIFKSCGADTRDQMPDISLDTKGEADGRHTITELKSSEVATDGVVLRCPRCQQEVLVADDDDRWERMKMHIIAFHLDDVA